ncbi:MAG: ABC transporter permease, partial [Oscillochloris sp.]|nr:ABC transporter permease [Oscillochloris sp.]
MASPDPAPSTITAAPARHADAHLAGRGLTAPWRKVLADLWASKTRTILAALSIAIGVFAVGAVIGTFIFINRDLSRNYHAVKPSAATIYAWPNFDEDLISTVRHVPGVADVQGVSSFAVRARTGPNEWRTISLLAVDDLTTMRINIVRPDSGAWPVGNREVLLERSGLSMFKLPLDQPLEIELANGTRRTLPISGVAHDAMGTPAVFSGEPTGFVSFDTIEWLGGTRGYSRMYVTLDQPGATEAQIKA